MYLTSKLEIGLPVDKAPSSGSAVAARQGPEISEAGGIPNGISGKLE
jgi:hypothetical protein